MKQLYFKFEGNLQDLERLAACYMQLNQSKERAELIVSVPPEYSKATSGQPNRESNAFLTLNFALEMIRASFAHSHSLVSTRLIVEGLKSDQ